jgi:hypothetical protein
VLAKDTIRGNCRGDTIDRDVANDLLFGDSPADSIAAGRRDHRLAW